MARMNIINKGVVFSMVVALMALSLQMPARADMIDNTQLSAQTEIQIQRDELRSILAREDLRKAMQDYGVRNADIDQRINNMTPYELNQIHGRMANLPAGEGAAGTVLTVLLILLILEILGVTDIFSGV